MTETTKQPETTRLTDDEAIAHITSFFDGCNVNDLAAFVSRYCNNGPIIVTGHRGDSDPFENGERIQVGKAVILAEAHSDDRAVNGHFDAVNWFKSNTDASIKKLADCGWGGDYPSDEVATALTHHVPFLQDMFGHIEWVSQPGKPLGFECHVDATDAMRWLDEHRPELAQQLRADEDVDTDSTLPRD